MEISWKDNIKKTVRMAYLGGKPVREIWLQRKQLYPDASASSVLALRPMQADNYFYPWWAWVMDIMKEESYEFYEFLVENKTDLNGGQDFVVVAEKEYNENWAKSLGWSGSFDPETFLLSCYANDMKVWAGMQEVGKEIKVKLRNARWYEKRFDISNLIVQNPFKTQVTIPLPYMCEGPNSDHDNRVSIGTNYCLEARGDHLGFAYNHVWVIGNPSGVNHIHGELLGLAVSQTAYFSGAAYDRSDPYTYFLTYDNIPNYQLGWKLGDTSHIVELNAKDYGTGPTTYRKINLKVILPEKAKGEYYTWNAVIERKA